MMPTMGPIPPIHATMTFNLVWFLGMIVFVLALFLATIIWVIATRRIAQKQAQMKEAERQYEESPLPQSSEQPVVHQPQEEVLLRR